MKYLKLFNESLNLNSQSMLLGDKWRHFVKMDRKKIETQENTETSLILKDICLELEDNGYSILFEYLREVNRTTVIPMYIGVIIITKMDYKGHQLPFEIDDIEDVVNRIKEYLGPKWLREDKHYDYSPISALGSRSSELFQLHIKFKNI